MTLSFTINSFSSSLMLGITLYRNQPGIEKKVSGQIGYALVTVTATIESLAAATFSILSIPLYLFSSDLLKNNFNWLKSSLFTVPWSIINFILNPIADRLVADEQSALWIANTGNLLFIPPGAIL